MVASTEAEEITVVDSTVAVSMDMDTGKGSLVEDIHRNRLEFNNLSRGV
jgi:hypothetical protein